MKVFAVRHKPSGLFIPRLETGKRRGGSRLEPSNVREPRFFHNQIAARAFLSNWCQGIFCEEQSLDPEQYGEPYLTVTKQPHRKKEDMEIVSFRLVEIKPRKRK